MTNVSAERHRLTSGRTREIRILIFASSLATVFEWYDFYLYALLPVTIGTVFFSAVSPTANYIFALLSFASGFVLRPFGALVFGRIGDLAGRKYALLITITIMGWSTLWSACCPAMRR